jgi:hypothetical protein
MEKAELYDDKAVIVRSWGDKPVKMLLRSCSQTHCYVGEPASIREIGIPNEQVFAFSEDRFAALSAAYAGGNLHHLCTLYSHIPVEDLACNRYQDNVISSHDQEGVTDSEEVEVSGGQ